jgi:hypothetical protein
VPGFSIAAHRNVITTTTDGSDVETRRRDAVTGLATLTSGVIRQQLRIG